MQKAPMAPSYDCINADNSAEKSEIQHMECLILIRFIRLSKTTPSKLVSSLH